MMRGVPAGGDHVLVTGIELSLLLLGQAGTDQPVFSPTDFIKKRLSNGFSISQA
jgi:hypothetical protein